MYALPLQQLWRAHQYLLISVWGSLNRSRPISQLGGSEGSTRLLRLCHQCSPLSTCSSSGASPCCCYRGISIHPRVHRCLPTSAKMLKLCLIISGVRSIPWQLHGSDVLLCALVQVLCSYNCLHGLAHQYSAFSTARSSAFFQVKMPHHSLLPWFVLLQNNSMLYLTTKLHFLNSLKFLRSEKHSPKTFLFLLISNVHFMCRIDSYFLLNLSDPQQPTG